MSGGIDRTKLAGVVWLVLMAFNLESLTLIKTTFLFCTPAKRWRMALNDAISQPACG
jgi:hypothetical protein